MKTLQMLLVGFLLSGFEVPAQAMGKSTCHPLTGAYVLQACDDAGPGLWLPSQERHQNGSLFDHMGALAPGAELRLTQENCDRLTLDFQSKAGLDHLDLRKGSARIAGPAEQISGSTTITRKVSRTSGGIAVGLDARYTYVPVISVWHTRANWKFERAGAAGLQITYEHTNKQRRTCTLVPNS